MDPTVAVAALGFITTVLVAWLSIRWQRRADFDMRLLDAKVDSYRECTRALYEYERAAYNRAINRIDHPGPDREELRQEAYKARANARAAVGAVVLLSGRELLFQQLDAIRASIGSYSDINKAIPLQDCHKQVYVDIEKVLGKLRHELMERPQGLEAG